MHPRAKVRNAAILVRNKLIPACPVIKHRGKIQKVLPVVVIHQPDPLTDPIIQYALPEGSKEVKIPEQVLGFKVVAKLWEGPAPKDIQKLALRLFGAKK